MNFQFTRLIFSSLFMLSCISVATAQRKGMSNNSENKNTQLPNSTFPAYQENGVAQNATKKINPVNGYDLIKLKAIQARLRQNAERRKNEAIQFCLDNNLSIRKTLPNGSVAEIKQVLADGTPIYYVTTNVDAAISTRANYLNTGGGLGLGLDGDNITVHVWDGGHARTTHQEYDGLGGTNRVTIMDAGSEGGVDLNFHATHVTGTICAAGVFADAKGMAWQSDVRSYKWNLDDTEAAGQTTATGINNNFGMLLSNHSYGYDATTIPDAWFGQYGSDAQDWDDIMYNAPYYLMVNSAGNDGSNNTANGSPLSGNASYDKLNGISTTKNNFVIANGNDANINGDGSLASVTRNSGSSEGPTDDLRIKPDVMGNGTSLTSTLETSDTAYGDLTGTSMSSPNVTGTLALLQEYYYRLHGTFMRAATLKGLALHTADDVTPSNSNTATASLVGPDATTGWGLMNAKFAAETLTTAAASSGSAIVEELTLNNGQTYQIMVQSNGSDPLMASISWTDPAHAPISGTNNNTPALVNDLDLNVDNGSTFYPWRLTGVNTNANNAENNVDPYERVDVTGASGMYTITVNHDGSISGGSQDYTLIVTGVVVASTPLISFGNTTDSINEDTDCSFTDINVPLNIAMGASANADVNFIVNGVSTATSGLDFDLITSNVTFPAGSTASQNMILRVYHDGFIEGTETVAIDFTVNANGGDAAADTNADSFTLTISDNDVAPAPSNAFTLFDEDFETAPTGWVSSDRDGDGNGWLIGAPPGPPAHLTSHNLYSQSWISTTGALTPDNYVITSAITLPATATALDFSYQVAPATLTNPWYEEYYTVYWATDISSYATIDASPQIKPGGIVTQAVVTETIDMTPYLGQTGYIVFRHHNCTDEEYIAIDDMLLSGTSVTNIQTAVNSGTPDEFDLLGAGTVYSSDPSTGDLMADITNNNSFDYGCVNVSVSRSGTGAQAYNGSSLPNHVMDKTFDVTPSNTAGAGSTSVTFYFEEAEIAGWETATGLSRTALVAGRGNTSSITETSSLSIGSFGSHVTLTGNFTGLDGTYYFGPTTAFASCAGTTKTWNGSTWGPPGAPDTTNPVILTANYNTATNGNLEACTLLIDGVATLTVGASNYVQVQGNITVDGALVVEHQGSLVQVDDNAIVINNGSIDVRVTTPNLASRDFMILGSPMSGETRNGVWNSAFLVLNHETNNFVPHPGVAATFPFAENFADDNYDNWIAHTGNINVGEGYIVRPQSGYGQPGGIFNFIFVQGTLNNGIVNFPVIYNGTKNASPNIMANPYASAIWAEDFINANAMVDEVYFWEHNTPPSNALPGAGTMNFSMEDISVYNLGGGVAAASGGSAPNGYIATGQGFGVKANATGTAVFNNSMRRTDNNNTLRTPAFEKDCIWLKVNETTYDIGATTLIGFSEATTNEIDKGYDSRRLATVVSLYSHLQDGSQELGIQTLGAFNNEVKVPIGFSTLVKDELEYTISLEMLEGSNVEGISIFLADNVLGIVTDLTVEDYVFTSGEGMQNGRFTLFFERTPLGTNQFDAERIALYPNPTQDFFYVASPVAELELVTLFDLQGRIVKQVDVTGSMEKISMEKLAASVYFVKVQTSQGSLVAQVVKK